MQDVMATDISFEVVLVVRVEGTGVVTVSIGVAHGKF